MKIEEEIAALRRIEDQVSDINTRIHDAIEKTNNLLAICDHMRVTRIGIGARNNSLKDSADYPFNYSGSIFVDGKKDGWPKAWAVAECAGIQCGCGNSGQHDVSGDFIDGVYEIKGGQWQRVK